MVFARSAAMAFNRLTDRDVDAGNPRTQGRHLVTGALSYRGVALFTMTAALGFVASTALFLPNPWPLRLAVPVLVFICLYSLTKRFTWGIAFLVGLFPAARTRLYVDCDSRRSYCGSFPPISFPHL